MSGTRRGNRESWIRDGQNSRGNYEAFVTMGTRPDGKPDRRHIERKTLAAVRRRVRELERSRDAGVIGKPGRVQTVEQMLTRHLEVVLPQRGRAPATIASYTSLCKGEIFPRWGGQRIDRLLPEHIEDGYSEMLGRGLSAGTVRKVHAVLSSAYDIEVKRENVRRNPCRLVEAPRLAQPAKTALSVAQARAVVAVAGDRRNAARWSVGLACGLRQGETLGLRWEYTDLDAGELRVWWQLQRRTWQHGCASPARCGQARSCPARHGGGLVFCEIKERRRKTVPLPSLLVSVLRAHRVQQSRERLAAANVWEDFGLVFAQPNGRPLDPRADWQEWGDILVAAGLPRAGTHSMRHTAASVGLDEGTALAVVQELLGHSDVRVTRGYTHVSSALAADGAERIGQALLGPIATRTATRRK